MELQEEDKQISILGIDTSEVNKIFPRGNVTDMRESPGNFMFVRIAFEGDNFSIFYTGLPIIKNAQEGKNLRYQGTFIHTKLNNNT